MFNFGTHLETSLNEMKLQLSNEVQSLGTTINGAVSQMGNDFGANLKSSLNKVKLQLSTEVKALETKFDGEFSRIRKEFEAHLKSSLAQVKSEVEKKIEGVGMDVGVESTKFLRKEIRSESDWVTSSIEAVD